MILLERERETLMQERSIDWLPPMSTPIADQAHSLALRPDWESTRSVLVNGLAVTNSPLVGGS